MGLGVGVVRVHLHAQAFPGLQQLQQQRERPARVSAHQLFTKLSNQIRQLPSLGIRALQAGNAADFQAFAGMRILRFFSKQVMQPGAAPGGLFPVPERRPHPDRPQRGFPLQGLVKGNKSAVGIRPVQLTAAAEAHLLIQGPGTGVSLDKVQFNLQDVRIGFRDTDHLLHHDGTDSLVPVILHQRDSDTGTVLQLEVCGPADLGGTNHFPVRHGGQEGFCFRSVDPFQISFFRLRSILTAFLGIAEEELRFTGGLIQVIQNALDIFLPRTADQHLPAVLHGILCVFDNHGAASASVLFPVYLAIMIADGNVCRQPE